MKAYFTQSVLVVLVSYQSVSAQMEVEIQKATKLNSPADVQALLRKGANPNTKLDNSLTLVEWVAGKGHVNLLKDLDKRGVNMSVNQGNVLALAIANNHAEAVSFLLDKGQTLHAKHPTYTLSLRELANFHVAQGRYKQAEPLYLDCVKILEKSGERQAELATTLNKLADMYRIEGIYAKADSLFQKSLRLFTLTTGEQSLDYAGTLNNLANLYTTQGNYPKAEPLFIQSLQTYEKIVSKEHLFYASTLENLANLHVAQGQYAKAEPLLLQCLQIKERATGNKNADYATSLHNLAMVYYIQSQHAKAEPLFLQCLQIIDKVLGKQNPDYATPLTNLANLYQTQGKYTKAEPLYQESLQIYKRLFGENHDGYATALHNLAELYAAQGDYSKAEPLYQKDLLITEQTVGKQHPNYATTLNNLANLYRSLGQYAKAKPLYQQCLQSYSQAVGKKHTSYANTLSNLASLLKSQHNYAEADTLFQEAILIREQVLGKNHPDYAISLGNWAGLLEAQGQYAKAEQLYQQCQQIFEKAVGKRHTLYATALESLALLYQRQGSYAKAEPLFEECLLIREQALGKNHPQYSGTLNSLAKLYESQAKYARSELLIRQARQQYRTQLRSQIALLNESSIKEFQEHFDNNQFGYSLAYTAHSQSLAGELYSDALISKEVGLLASRQLGQLLSTTKDQSVRQVYGELRDTRLLLSKQYSRPLARQRGVDSLQRQATTLEQQLIHQLPMYGQAFKALAVEWQQVQAKLKADQAAIEFVHFRYQHNGRFTDSTYYMALVVRPNWPSPRTVFLGEQRAFDSLLVEATASAASINGLYRGGKAGNSNQQQLTKGVDLARLIWQPLDSLLGGVKTVVVSVSGRLHQIALAALPNPTDTSQRTCMSDRYQIQQVGSTRIVALPKPDQSLNTATVGSYLYGGIAYDTDSITLTKKAHIEQIISQQLAQRDATRSGVWTYLKGTQTEVDNLKKILPARYTTALSGLSATESSVKGLSGHSPNVLHIATHGFFFPDLSSANTDQQPNSNSERTQFEVAEDPLLRSGLIMAGANYVWKGGTPIDGVDDGILTAYEVSGLNLNNTELVVLSACETGLGTVKGSEGVYGLQRAFKMAGARYLLISLWRVPDQETAAYMTLFYRQLLQTGSVPVAYRHAQAQMRKLYPQEPYKWAAFVLIE